MTLHVVLLAIGLLALGALGAALAGRNDRAALVIGTGTAALACLFGALASLGALLGVDPGASSAAVSWAAPVGELRVGLDALSAFFLLCVFLVSGLAAVYGAGYLRQLGGKHSLAAAAAFFNLLAAAMALVVVARDGVLFLMAWEVMSITSFFLVTFENDRDDVRRAGTTYLVASHTGVVLLILLFALLGRHAGGFGFAAMERAGVPPHAGLLFVLAVVGFGAKAGFWPVHVWLPDAHPAAPSHVSAVMSGVMIKMGIYGLFRALTFLGPPPAWWGAALVGIGIVSGIGGVLHALAQHDLKRLLAYHSVENIGIIALGLGLGLLGQSQHEPMIAFLGYAGALLHVLNHGLFKGLLFQGAGSVLHATGTRDIDSLGGLGRRMPVTAATFLVASIAISGLPPLNGFVSEWLVYMAAFRAGGTLPVSWAITGILVAPALALIGGLAAACFVKAYGVVFLGEPRTAEAHGAHESGGWMRGPMITAALLCALIGLAAPAAVRIVSAPALAAAGLTSEPAGATGPLGAICRVAAVLLGIIAVLALLRARLLGGRDVRSAATWGCGYAHGTARMQYTAASFAQPLLAPFSSVFSREQHRHGPDGFFPDQAEREEHLGDRADGVIRPAVRLLVAFLGKLRAIQHGRTPLYLAYVLVTLLALLLWHVATRGSS